MQIKHLPTLFEPARPVLQKIETAGYEAYFVGGCVRDTILGDPIHDIDIATSAYPSEIKAIFKRTVDTGIQHGTVMILDHGTGYETTTFRTESGYQDYRRPDKVTFVRSLKDDLKRRDFTINALAMKEDGTVIDLFNGLSDLQNQIIKAVGNPEERFHEDALRMMRAVRFASKLDFNIEDATLKGITDNGKLLTNIAIERIEVEFSKLLLGSNPPKGLQYFIDTNLYQYCPNLINYKDALQKLADAHNWSIIKNKQQAWSVLIYALQLTDRGKITSFMKQWKLPNDLINHVQKVIKLVDKIKQDHVDNLALFEAGIDAVKSAVIVAKFFGWPHHDLVDQFDRLPIQDSHQLAVNGGNLIQQAGIKPGPELGKIISQLQRMVVNGQLPNNTEVLIQTAKRIIEKG
ncbi:MAG: CCA tRNA nucleotidyltransferase [Lactobacillus sp.]|uniref:CCA tRNA nucleotidyltransferase n=1 Tax=Limosilactobacillus coleohominis TaxID=181675 RepID=UPI002A90EEC2|nr:CCA tRNA nucleotidyltransferase [Limosilactobacillus coleohominis]MCI5813219.1 CCA tRNA nucleotidyltransferase [Lactobacillus sp.]MDY5628322.1 CCA tRNA nucleotidyltransferase [Limosilactobacillus coleohominis]